MRLGMILTLAVRGRTSGEWRTVPVNVLELDGQRYLVAPRGDTQWVRNLRATGRGELRWRGRIEPFRATEIPDNEKPRLILDFAGVSKVDAHRHDAGRNETAFARHSER
jgi:deazaflavin-dependent oxidoreductase (nitroreductase family)